MGQTNVELVVIGAGAAGLAATKTAVELGIHVIAFEAMDRIGGRAFTRMGPFGFPWDAGCLWLHSASANAFTAFAGGIGFRYQENPEPWSIWVGNRRSTDRENAEIDAFLEDVYIAAMECGDRGIDVAIGEVADTANPWIDVLRLESWTDWGVDIDAVSTLDVARYRDTDEDWPVIDGYGALVARVAGPLPIALSTPVETIDWTQDGVRVTTSNGTLAAAMAIVTVSTGVLADGLIAFDPPLPIWKQEAFAAAPLGRADKVALMLDPGALEGVPEQNLGVPIASGAMISMRVRPFGRPLVDCYLAGPPGAELAAAGEPAMIAAAVDAMVSVFGAKMRQRVVNAATSNWANERFIRGAYSAASPGHAHRRGDLVTPVGDRLLWAGEATSPEFFSTCHGAWESGVAAADVAADVVKRHR